jgi:hypothetical protein
MKLNSAAKTEEVFRKAIKANSNIQTPSFLRFNTIKA